MIAGVLLQCQEQAGETTETGLDITAVRDEATYQQAITALTGGEKTDRFTLKSVKIDDDELVMYIEVSYGGGCAKHTFELIWPDIILGIYPPQFSIVLNHQANGDTCKALLTQTLKIDLTNNALNLDDQSIKDMRVTVINGSNPDEKVQNE